MHSVSKYEALIATLAYADVFGYALTREELIRWFLYYPVSTIRVPNGIGFFLAYNKIQRQNDKWAIANKAGQWLAMIPTIQLVGVTGGLAMNNARASDDIDFFLIVADGTLWVSRLLATFAMDILGLRRHPKDVSVANKICLNMFMTAGATGLVADDRDCFTAHEVLQMVPIWEQQGSYKKFLLSNRWVTRYLPNAWKEKNTIRVAQVYTSIRLVIYFLRLFEWPAKKFQLWYMARSRTREVITDTVLRFHPHDARVWIKRNLAVRLAKVHIPLDKVFYAG